MLHDAGARPSLPIIQCNVLQTYKDDQRFTNVFFLLKYF